MLKQVLIEASLLAGTHIKNSMNTQFSIANKPGNNNLVTEVDKKAEEIILSTIAKTFPDHAILSEEIGAIEKKSTYKWIIDPLDGTVNFAHGMPLCATSIAVEKDGEIIMGAIYHPFLNELFFAEKGKGAFMNDRKISVSSCSDLDTSYLVTGFPYDYIVDDIDPLQLFGNLVKRGIPVRRLGSAAIDLAWVACGRFDGFYEFKLNPWDVAAGYILVQEAGGKITNFKGQNFDHYGKELLATNNNLHPAMVNMFNA